MKSFILITILLLSFSSFQLDTSQNCGDQSTWNPATNSCQACSGGGDCYYDGTNQIKVQCPGGNINVKNQCIPCVDGCLDCFGNTGKCRSYKWERTFISPKTSPYYPFGISPFITSSVTSCKVSLNVTYCAACNDITMLINGVCQGMDRRYCSLFDSEMKCVKCLPGFYMGDNASCQRCPSDCSECVGSKNCTKCKMLNVKPVGDQCLTCYEGDPNPDVENCVSCEDTVPYTYNSKSYTYKCTRCRDSSFFIHPDHPYACLKRPVACEITEDLSYCSGNCLPGYFKNDKTCQSCPSKCLTCKLNEAGERSCISCYKGYYLNANGICLPCNTLQNPCLECESPTKCTVCPRGTYLSKNSCVACLNGCNNCFDNLLCLTCDIGLYLSPDKGTCVEKCPQNSKTITEVIVSANNKTWTGVCVYCEPDQCKTCKASNQICEECTAEYKTWRVDLKNTICISKNEVRACHESCLTCGGTGANDCLSCKNNYFLDESSGSCLKDCPVGSYNRTNAGGQVCTKCVDSGCIRCNVTFCYECKDGFFETDFGACKPCSANCQSCSDENECDFCSSPLLANYNPYSKDGKTECLKECAKGFILDEDDKLPGDCVPCRENCTQGCADGLSLYLGNCIPQCPFGYESVLNSNTNSKSCELMGEKEIASLLIEPKLESLSIYRDYEFTPLYGSNWNVTSFYWQLYEAKNPDDVTKSNLKLEGRSELFKLTRENIAPNTLYLLRLNISYNRNENSLKAYSELPLRTTANRLQSGYFRVTPLEGTVPSTPFQVSYGDLTSVKDGFQYVIEVKDGNRVLARVASFYLSLSLPFTLPYSMERKLNFTLTLNNFETEIVKYILVAVKPDRKDADEKLKLDISKFVNKKDVNDYLITYFNVKNLKIGTDAAANPDLFEPVDAPAKELIEKAIIRLTELTSPIESGMGLDTILPLINSTDYLTENSFNNCVKILRNFINSTAIDSGAISSAVEVAVNLIKLVPNYTNGSNTTNSTYALVDAIDEIFLDIYDEVATSFSSRNPSLLYTVQKLFRENSLVGQKISVSKTQGISLLNVEVLLPGNAVGDGTRLARVAVWENSPYRHISSKKVYSKMVTVDVANSLTGKELALNISKTPVQIQIPKDIVYYDVDLKKEDISCAWFDRSITDWNSEGCSVVEIKKLSVNCECLHLSDFAIVEKLKSSSTGSNFGSKLTGYLGSASVLVIILLLL